MECFGKTITAFSNVFSEKSPSSRILFGSADKATICDFALPHLYSLWRRQRPLHLPPIVLVRPVRESDLDLDLEQPARETHHALSGTPRDSHPASPLTSVPDNVVLVARAGHRVPRLCGPTSQHRHRDQHRRHPVYDLAAVAGAVLHLHRGDQRQHRGRHLQPAPRGLQPPVIKSMAGREAVDKGEF